MTNTTQHFDRFIRLKLNQPQARWLAEHLSEEVRFFDRLEDSERTPQERLLFSELRALDAQLDGKLTGSVSPAGFRRPLNAPEAFEDEASGEKIAPAFGEWAIDGVDSLIDRIQEGQQR